MDDGTSKHNHHKAQRRRFPHGFDQEPPPNLAPGMETRRRPCPHLPSTSIKYTITANAGRACPARLPEASAGLHVNPSSSYPPCPEAGYGPG